MIHSAQCVAVIPCLNEGATIGELVGNVRALGMAVIVVDDGSTDRTSDVAASAGAEVIRHGRPGGKGAALKAGWARAMERGYDWALSLDGDGQHAPEDIPRFLERAGESNLIVGNRMGNSSAMPWLRRRVNRWMSARLSRAAGCALPDSQCGFRLMRLSVWSGLRLVTSHYEVESEILLAFAAAGEKPLFVPIQVIYKDESSKIHPIRDTLRWFCWFWRRGG